jgi:ABC-type sulfate transport system permease component
LGIVIALTFIGLPFVVRTVQPVLQDGDKQVEEAAATIEWKKEQQMLDRAMETTT